jgi:hypothetical protein
VSDGCHVEKEYSACPLKGGLLAPNVEYDARPIDAI